MNGCLSLSLSMNSPLARRELSSLPTQSNPPEELQLCIDMLVR